MRSNTLMKFDGFQEVSETPEAWGSFTNLFEGRSRQMPFLVVDGNFAITVCDSIAKVMRHDDNCIVLKQWPGTYRSDWFKTTVKEFREVWEAKKRADKISLSRN